MPSHKIEYTSRYFDNGAVKFQCNYTKVLD